MCGIFGVLGRVNHAGLREAALTLKHRGPDAFGEWAAADPPVYLAHCRLSIIDLSDAGRQPLANEDGTVQVTYNGEIYNFAELRAELESRGHRFRSRTDTEVIVHAYEEWGAECVDRFRGIFAFGLWDANRRRLLLARDRLGVKPLYYTICGNQLAFASEPRALLAIPGVQRSLFTPAAIHFLQHTYKTGPTTIWKDIFQLPPAHVLEYDSAWGTVTRRRYWRLPEIDRSWTLAAATERADELMSESITEELVSDVPVGVFLSGGVDSSMISSYAVESSPSINSFCVDFVGWDGSEAADSQSVADHLGTRHHICPIDRQHDRLGNPETLTEFFKSWDEPIGDPAILPTWLISRLTCQHVTVALSGDGGDELFSGYSWYQDVQPTPRRKLSWFVEGLRRNLGFGRPWPRGSVDPFEHYQMLHSPTFTMAELHQLFPDWRDDIAQSAPGDVFKPWFDSDSDPRRRWQIVDLNTYLPDNNLMRVDRASMAHSLEIRVPLLDHRLVEFAFSLPDHCCFEDGQTKRLLRELMRRRLPANVQNKRKQGFSFPLERFITQQQMWSRVHSGCLVRNGLLNAEQLQKWREGPHAGNFPLKLWLLFVFENWARIWLFEQEQTASGAVPAPSSLVGAAS